MLLTGKVILRARLFINNKRTQTISASTKTWWLECPVSGTPCLFTVKLSEFVHLRSTNNGDNATKRDKEHSKRHSDIYFKKKLYRSQLKGHIGPIEENNRKNKGAG